MRPKSKAKTKPVQAKVDVVPVVSPSWPSLTTLTPLPPREHLSLTTLVPGQIITIPDLFTPTLCAKYIEFLRTLPLTATSSQPQKGHAVRVNDRFQVQDPNFAAALWEQTALKYAVTGAADESAQRDLWGGQVLGLNPSIRIYRYIPGHFFGAHYDDSNNISFPVPDSSPAPAKTTWTLLLYLSTCEGGDTVFYPEPLSKKAPTPAPVVVAPEMGMALLHRHGKECMLHEGKEVIKGEKWVIRSDLCVRR